jgi:hypothetical protein
MEQGILDFNRALYWEAHESWEQGWVKLLEPDKSWIKAMIQVCGVMVHIQKKRRDPALRLALRAIELMAEAKAHRELLGSRAPWPIEIPGADETLLQIAARLKVISDQDLNWSELESLGLSLKAKRG